MSLLTMSEALNATRWPMTAPLVLTPGSGAMASVPSVLNAFIGNELATLAHMANEYEVRYFLYSEAVHPDPVALLRRHVPSDKNAFRFEPEDDVRIQMCEVLETLGKTARALITSFQDRQRPLRSV